MQYALGVSTNGQSDGNRWPTRMYNSIQPTLPLKTWLPRRASISPQEGAEYLQKTECFAFSSQPLSAGEGNAYEGTFL